MSIKFRLALLLGLLLAVFLCALVVLRELERRQLDRTMEDSRRGAMGLMERWMTIAGDSLARFVSDYGQWTEMVEFVGSGDPAWARVNLEPSLANFDVHALWVLDGEGRLVHGVAEGGGMHQEVPLPEEGARLWLEGGSYAHFFAECEDGVMEIRTAPILTSEDVEKVGQPSGWLLAARLWDDNYLGNLAGLTDSRASLTRRGEAKKEGKVGGTTLIRPLVDWQDEVIGTLQLHREPDELLMRFGTDSAEAKVFIVFGLLVIVSLGVSLHAWVLRPLGWIGDTLADGNTARLRPLTELRKDELGKVAGLIEMAFAQRKELELEVDERRRVEEALRRSEAEVRETLEERARLGRDLHDGVIQAIYAAGMGLAVARAELGTQPGEADRKIGQVHEALNGTIRDLRQFITGLEPVGQEAESFEGALAALLEFLRATTKAELVTEVEDVVAARLSTTARADALQIIREAVSNGIRHGQASRVVISLRGEGETGRLEVCDNGVGFDAARPRPGGRGLINMRERAEESSATFKLETTPGNGTRVQVRFPLAEYSL